MGAVRAGCWQPGASLQEAGQRSWGRLGQEVAEEAALWRDRDGPMRVKGEGAETSED